MKSNKSLGFTKVGDIEVLGDFHFGSRHDGWGKGGNGRVVDMNDDNREAERIPSNVNAEVGFNASISKSVDENIVEFDVPNAASLLKTIEGLMQTTSAGCSVFIAGRLFHEDSFLQFAVEVCTNNVDLVDFPVLGSS